MVDFLRGKRGIERSKIGVEFGCLLKKGVRHERGRIRPILRGENFGRGLINGHEGETEARRQLMTRERVGCVAGIVAEVGRKRRAGLA